MKIELICILITTVLDILVFIKGLKKLDFANEQSRQNYKQKFQIKNNMVNNQTIGINNIGLINEMNVKQINQQQNVSDIQENINNNELYHKYIDNHLDNDGNIKKIRELFYLCILFGLTLIIITSKLSLDILLISLALVLISFFYFNIKLSSYISKEIRPLEKGRVIPYFFTSLIILLNIYIVVWLSNNSIFIPTKYIEVNIIFGFSAFLLAGQIITFISIIFDRYTFFRITYKKKDSNNLMMRAIILSMLNIMLLSIHNSTFIVSASYSIANFLNNF